MDKTRLIEMMFLSLKEICDEHSTLKQEYATLEGERMLTERRISAVRNLIELYGEEARIEP